MPSSFQTYSVSDQRKSDQKSVDASIVAAIKKAPDAKLLRQYLTAKFCLGKGDLPHKMVF